MAVQFNLLPWREARREKKRKHTQFALISAVLVGMALGGAYYFWEKTRLSDYEQALTVLQDKNQSLILQLKEKRDLDKLKEHLTKQVDAIDALQADRGSVLHMVEELSNANTQELFLNEFVLQNGEVRITGVAENDTQVSDFMKKLRESVWYQTPALVEIITNKKLGQEIKNFIITSKLLLPGAQAQQEGEDNG